MKFTQRLLYYMGGLAMGLVILFFFLGGKKTSCSYGPNARVLKDLRHKPKAYSSEAKEAMKTFQVDSLAIDNMLQNGDVVFGESQTDTEPCKTYVVQYKVNEEELKSTFKNCDSLVTLLKIEPSKN